MGVGRGDREMDRDRGGETEKLRQTHTEKHRRRVTETKER